MWRSRKSAEDVLKTRRFENAVLPHLSAAYNLARRLTRHSENAEDLVQEACMRAFKFFDGFQGNDARAWLLTIVRNTCYTWKPSKARMKTRMPSMCSTWPKSLPKM